MGNMQPKTNNTNSGQLTPTSIGNYRTNNTNVGTFEARKKGTYELLTIDLKLLFTRELTDGEMNNYNEIDDLKIIYLSHSSYVFNLHKLPKLKTLRILDIQNQDFFQN